MAVLGPRVALHPPSMPTLLQESGAPKALRVVLCDVVMHSVRRGKVINKRRTQPQPSARRPVVSASGFCVETRKRWMEEEEERMGGNRNNKALYSPFRACLKVLSMCIGCLKQRWCCLMQSGKMDGGAAAQRRREWRAGIRHAVPPCFLARIVDALKS